MASKSAILAVRIITDAKQATKGFDDTAGGVDKLRGKLDKMTPAAGVALAGITGLAVSAGNAAAEAEQAVGAVESVFGAYAKETAALAENASTNVGLAATDYNNLSAILGAQLKNMGVAEGELVGQTDELIGMGADLAATFGGSTADAVAALSSLMRGERDPIERYGVSIKQADIEAKKAELGLSGLSGEAARAADTQATLALLTEQTASAQGQFSREADTAAGAQQRANAQWADAQVQLGQVLLPVMTQAATVAAGLAGWISENSTVVTILAAVIGGLAAGILILNGIIRAYQVISVIATAAQVAWNVAMTANPIGLIIAAIAVLIGIIVLLVTNWETVERVVSDVIRGIVTWIENLVRKLGIQKHIDAIVRGFQRAGDSISAVWRGVIGWIEDAVGVINDAVGAVGQFLGISGGGDDEPLDGDPSAAWGTGPWPAWSASVGSSSAPSVGGQVINVTINGALDPEAVARQVRDVLRRFDRTSGITPALGAMA